jgi:hypothetical protein
MSFANQRIALENMVIARDLLASEGVPIFLNFGTLLGAIREKGFIPHDHDVDVGILERDRAAFLAALPKLASRGLVVTTELRPGCQMISTFRNGEQLDFFVARPIATIKGRKWDLDSFTHVPAYHLDGFDEIDFLGERFKIPRDPEAFLRHLYGSTWGIPIDGKIAHVELSVRFAAAFHSPLRTIRSIPTFLHKRLGWAAQVHHHNSRAS